MIFRRGEAWIEGVAPGRDMAPILPAHTDEPGKLERYIARAPSPLAPLNGPGVMRRPGQVRSGVSRLQSACAYLVPYATPHPVGASGIQAGAVRSGLHGLEPGSLQVGEAVIRVVVNGEECDVPDRLTVAGLLAHLDLPTRFIAVERNREIVPRAEHGATLVENGDRLEIVTMVGGG